MAKRYVNDKGFLILELTKADCQKVGFGNVCDGTCAVKNNCIPRVFTDEEPRYYIACINSLMCKNCLDAFLATQPYYDDDDSLDYEDKHYTPIAQKFGLIYGE